MPSSAGSIFAMKAKRLSFFEIGCNKVASTWTLRALPLPAGCFGLMPPAHVTPRRRNLSTVSSLFSFLDAEVPPLQAWSLCACTLTCSMRREFEGTQTYSKFSFPLSTLFSIVR